MRKQFTLLFFLMCITLSYAYQDTNDNAMVAFEQANKAYAADNYDVSIIAYNEILKLGVQSAEVYFNLGNAYYKKNQVGPAIYNYEKALQLDPEDQDIITNLSFANQMKIDAIETLPENQVSLRVNNIVSSLEVDEWAYVSIVLILLAILTYVLFIYSATPGKKRLFFIVSFVLLLLAISTVIAAFYAKNGADEYSYGIVYESEFKTRNEPKNTAEVSFIIHEGTKVEIIDTFEKWSQIKLANGSKAWMPSSMIKRL